jgi:hypothetical protein
MKWNSGVAIAVLLAAAAGCATEGAANGSKNGVRITNNATEVAGCEKVTEVRVNGAWTRGAARSELSALARSAGANTLLLEGEKPTSGLAYRCAAPSVAAR